MQILITWRKTLKRKQTQTTHKQHHKVNLELNVGKATERNFNNVLYQFVRTHIHKNQFVLVEPIEFF